ncbi:MAG: hypothetical protein HQK49_01770 [Oligoflexia bacterium]|nr:hypothetical protein [Oligoflexia bacterium]
MIMVMAMVISIVVNVYTYEHAYASQEDHFNEHLFLKSSNDFQVIPNELLCEFIRNSNPDTYNKWILINKSFNKIFKTSMDQMIRLQKTVDLKSGSYQFNYSRKFSPDQKYLYISSYKNNDTAMVIDTTTAAKDENILYKQNSDEMVDYIHFSPKGNYMFVKTRSNEIVKISSIKNKLNKHNFNPFKNFNKVKINSIDFSADEKYVVATFNDNTNTANIIDVESGKIIHTIQHNREINSALFSADGKYVVTTSDDKSLNIFELNSGNIVNTIQNTNYYRAKFIGANSEYLLTESHRFSACEIRNIEIVNPKNGQVLHTSFSCDPYLTAVAPKSKKFIVTAADNGRTVEVINLEKMDVKKFDHDSSITSITISPDENYIVSTSNDKTAKILDLKSGKIKEIKHPHEVHSANITPDGNYLITNSWNITKIIKLKSDNANHLLSRTIKYSDEIKKVIVSPDGRYMLAISYNQVFLVSIEGAMILKVLLNKAMVGTVTFSSDSKQIIIVNDSDYTINYWKIEN